MARRYGRNQKRQAREALENALKAAEWHELTTHQASHREQQIRKELEYWDECITELLGPASSFRKDPPQQVMQGIPEAFERTLMQRSHILIDGGMEHEVLLTAFTERMELFLVAVEQDPLRMARYLRIKTTFHPGKEVALAISREHLMNCGIARRDAAIVAESLVRQLMKNFPPRKVEGEPL